MKAGGKTDLGSHMENSEMIYEMWQQFSSIYQEMFQLSDSQQEWCYLSVYIGEFTKHN